MRSFLLLFILLFQFNYLAHPEEARPTVYWAKTDIPPDFILRGPYAGTGYGDLLNNLMMTEIKMFNHETVIYPNWSRLKNEIRRSKDKVICTSTLFYRHPEMRKEYKGKQLFSAPNFVFFLHNLVIKKTNLHLFDKTVSLKQLLKNQNLKLGYSRATGPKSSKIIGDYLGVNKDISTMDVIDRLKALGSKQNIVVRLSSDMVSGSLQMLLKERVDYILEYEFMVDFEAKRLGIEEQLVSLPIEETLNDVSISAYSCSDTPDGEKVIAEINRILIEKRDSKAYKILLQYLIPKDSERKERYWEEYQKILSINK